MTLIQEFYPLNVYSTDFKALSADFYKEAILTIVISLEITNEQKTTSYKGISLSLNDLILLLGERPSGLLPPSFPGSLKHQRAIIRKVLNRKKRKDRDQALRVRAKITEDERRNQAQAVKQSIKTFEERK